jgi:ubiquinone/menaquinone biosynthesis C-methylase UbiE
MRAAAIAARSTFLARCPVCEAEGSAPVIAFPELAFVRCAACGLIYKREQVPQLGHGYEEEYFRTNRAKYLERWDHRVRKCRNQLLACLEYAPHARDVLDIGCSAGYVLEAARTLGLTPAGVDCSTFAVQLCRERGYRAELGDLTQLPLPDASFDIVTLKHTLEHVQHPMRGLREISRVLRPGGVAFLIVPDAAYYKIILMPRRGRSFRPNRRGWQHHVYFYERNLAEAARLAGLVPLKAGKDIFRRRLARGPRAAWERLRHLWLLLWVATCRATHLRREIQLIAGKPGARGVESPSPAA